ncbi:MAG: nucleotidyltransferase domain-containing protein [Syntrophaceae bacterium]|nr:nucleotidyltransferase domain-containing protein [Syntrophaceae bacterium]
MTLLEEVKKTILDSKLSFRDIEAIGVCGSLARGDFSSKSDIDIFIVIPDSFSEREVWLQWNRILREELKVFQRDITVLVYSLRSLKEVSSWYVLRLASEGKLIYDRNGKVEELFEKIVQTAKNSGLVEEEIHGHRYWVKKDIRIGETFEVSVSE